MFMGSMLSTHVACSRSNDPVQKGKQLYLPAQIYRVPENNDYNNKESEFCHSRKVESENIAIFWAKEYGERPQEHTVHLVDGKDENDEQWPYAIKLKGAAADAKML